ncbi:MAG TPA: phenylalanine--tRNA ligase subunit beta [Holophagaceae bacterium]|nr:phenylalanine--tRNA ligase subunit beta [Holophagaceae bacterium]
MLIALSHLKRELRADLSLALATDRLPMLGFPIDGVTQLEGDTVLDVDVTANRPDVMSHRGLARDLAAALGVELVSLAPQAFGGEPQREIRLETFACPLYCTAVLTLGGTQATPAEAQAFLRALGLSPKGLAAVDASNELLHRYGHPTHAFDADKLRGAIVVRFAKAGETLVTLDGIERKLTPEDLLIADDSGPIALAGVMGGESTKVTEATRSVLLESAWFDPKVVRPMARRHSLHSDASHRFGRGADPVMAAVARDLLAQRLVDWAGATLVAAWSVGAVPPSGAAITLPLAQLDRIAGEAVDPAEAENLLARLGCDVSRGGSALTAAPPSWRHDLALPEDLAEEVLRLRGYDRISSSLPAVDADPEPLNPAYRTAASLSRRLAHLGFFQTVTYGFIGPDEDAPFAGASNPPEGRALGNPLGLEYSVMRASLLPSLKATALHNRRQGQKEVRLFEIAPAYPAGLAGKPSVAIVWGGVKGGEDHLTAARPVQAADLRGIALSLGFGDAPIQDLGDGLLGVEVALEALAAPAERIIPRFQGFSRFPAVERDLSLVVDLGKPFGDLARAMGGVLPAELQHLGVVDVYRGKGMAPGKQALLVRFRFQHAQRTLTSEEVEGWVHAALAAAEGVGAALRA